MNFGAALSRLRTGRRIARVGWNGRGMWLLLIDRWTANDDGAHLDSVRLLPWIGMKTADDGFVPWLASQTDLLADDWVIVQ